MIEVFYSFATFQNRFGHRPGLLKINASDSALNSIIFLFHIETKFRIMIALKIKLWSQTNAYCCIFWSILLQNETKIKFLQPFLFSCPLFELNLKWPSLLENSEHYSCMAQCTSLPGLSLKLLIHVMAIFK